MAEPKICELNHKRVDERLDTHEKRLNSHSEELDKLCVSDARNTNERFTNLCKQIGDLSNYPKMAYRLASDNTRGLFLFMPYNQNYFKEDLNVRKICKVKNRC